MLVDTEKELVKSLSDKELSGKLGKNGRETVFKFFDYEQNMAKMLDTMNGVF